MDGMGWDWVGLDGYHRSKSTVGANSNTQVEIFVQTIVLSYMIYHILRHNQTVQKNTSIWKCSPNDNSITQGWSSEWLRCTKIQEGVRLEACLRIHQPSVEQYLTHKALEDLVRHLNLVQPCLEDKGVEIQHLPGELHLAHGVRYVIVEIEKCSWKIQW